MIVIPPPEPESLPLGWGIPLALSRVEGSQERNGRGAPTPHHSCARGSRREDWGEGDSESCPGAEDNLPAPKPRQHLVPEHIQRPHRVIVACLPRLHHQQQLINPEPHPLIDSTTRRVQVPAYHYPVLN